jgi:hypothetical protein
MDPINLQIEFLDSSKETLMVSAIAADLIAFEAHFDLSISRLGSDVRLTHLFFLGWHAAKRLKHTEQDFDAWLETVSMVKEAEVKK